MITFTDLGQFSYLGNELFQYAALVGVGERLGYEVRLPPSAQHRLGTLIELHSTTYTTQELRRLRYRFGQVYPNFGYEAALETVPDWCDIYGYFQSPRHFPLRLRDQFRIRSDVRASVAEVWSDLGLAGPVVGMHVRRGDSVGSGHWLSLDKASYYNAAQDFFAGESATFLVVSDDPDWCVDRFTAPNTVIAPRATAPVHLALMAQCDHLIAANSTFSWWAAWFQQPRGGRVIAPRRWYHPDTFDNAEQEFLPSWILM